MEYVMVFLRDVEVAVAHFKILCYEQNACNYKLNVLTLGYPSM